jgi:hypothetical protein
MNQFISFVGDWRHETRSVGACRGCMKAKEEISIQLRNEVWAGYEKCLHLKKDTGMQDSSDIFLEFRQSSDLIFR